MRRFAAAAGLTLLALGIPAGPASAHAGDGLAQPIFEHMAPTVPGVNVSVAYSANYELLVSTTTPEPVTFLADSGEPFLRIGPEGVSGNFASPTFYDSNSPEGLADFPPRARPGREVPPIWRTLATKPNWGWYDHRLHPPGLSLPPEVRRAGKVAVLGRWRVPFEYRGQPGELAGRFEYRPPTGSYTTVQTSSQTPAPGVKIQVAPGRTVPAIFVENLSPDPVVVLGRDGEPFARIGPKVAEVNVRSPIWVEIQQAQSHDPTEAADAGAPPQWKQVSDVPRWSWLEFRAASPKDDPPPAIVKRRKATTVKTWSVPYLLGERRSSVEGTTQFVPVAALRQPAGAGGGRSRTPLYAAAGLALGAAGAGALWKRRRGR